MGDERAKLPRKTGVALKSFRARTFFGTRDRLEGMGMGRVNTRTPPQAQENT